MHLSNTHRWRLPLVVGFLAASAAPVLTQEALRNVVREDIAYQARQTVADTEPRGWKAGPISFSPTASFGIELNDNVRNSEKKEADLILRPGAHVGCVWLATDKSRLSFGVGFGYSKYLEHSELNRGHVAPDSELAYDVSVKDLGLSVYDSFSYSQDVTSQASLSGVASLPRYDNTVGARATWTPHEAIVSMGYAHQNFLTAGSTNSQLDHTGEQLSLRAGYRIRPETSAGLEATGSWTDYGGVAQRDNASATIGPYLEWKVRAWLGIKLRGSYVYYRFDPTNSFDNPKPLNSYYASVEVDHQLTDHISQDLSATHDLQPSFYQGGDYVETTSIRYSINWALRQNTSMSVNLLYETGQQPGIDPLGGKEDFDRIGIGLVVRQNFTAKFSGSLGYDFINRGSSLLGRAYSQSRVTMTVNYAF